MGNIGESANFKLKPEPRFGGGPGMPMFPCPHTHVPALRVAALAMEPGAAGPGPAVTVKVEQKHRSGSGFVIDPAAPSPSLTRVTGYYVVPCHLASTDRPLAVSPGQYHSTSWLYGPGRSTVLSWLASPGQYHRTVVAI